MRNSCSLKEELVGRRNSRCRSSSQRGESTQWEEDYLGKGEGERSMRNYLEEGETMRLHGKGVYLDEGRGERTPR